MELGQIIGFIFLFLVVIVPALGATAHLVLQPMVEAIIRLRGEFGNKAGGAPVEHRLQSVEDELHLLRREVRKLKEAEAFYRVLSPPAEVVGTEGDTAPPEAMLDHSPDPSK